MHVKKPRPRVLPLALALALTPLALPLTAHAAGSTAAPSCRLGTPEHPLKHIVYLQFDNVHLRRDNPNVPSDLEQMPNLLHFLEGQGTLLTNHHTPLISHTSVDIVTSLTGVYGDKFGFSIGNSYGIFQPNGVASFQSSFAYWTDVVSDGLPQMVNQQGKTHPAPWVPFTRAGCDVGGFSIANIEFENTNGDLLTVFGKDSPQFAEGTSPDPAVRAKAVADFEGIIVHCAQNSKLCAKNAAPDLLNDEPGGYTGFTALYGNANVQPQISPSGPVLDLDGNVIADSHGNPGFPGFDPLASQGLGYVATMLEAGVPVVYFYISDAHDNESQSISGVSTSVEQTFGPGEQGYVNQLAAYNEAFGKFFARLQKDGITKDNTLFVVTSDENDHFVGGPPSPAGCDGIHTPCTYAAKGEVDADLSLVYSTEFAETTPFRVHTDDAPTFYINGNPAQTAAVTRQLEQEAARLQGFDPPLGVTNSVTQALAGISEQQLLHMVTFDPNRTPNFILFGNPDYFLSASGHTTPLCTPMANAASCFHEETGFAWNHGDFQNQITHTWLGIVGPGVRREGRSGETFTDHTDIRPTIISLANLEDDYAHDGRVITEVLDRDALPDSLREEHGVLERLGAAYKQINAPLGLLGRRTLTGLSTRALSGDDATYAALDAKLVALTQRRNEIASQMIAMLEDAEFHGIAVDGGKAERLIHEAEDLLEDAGH
jgi:hypothetical protein